MNHYMRISKDLALMLLEKDCLSENAYIVCRGYATEDDDFVEVVSDDVDDLKDDKYQTFEIWTR